MFCFNVVDNRAINTEQKQFPVANSCYLKITILAKRIFSSLISAPGLIFLTLSFTAVILYRASRTKAALIAGGLTVLVLFYLIRGETFCLGKTLSAIDQELKNQITELQSDVQRLVKVKDTISKKMSEELLEVLDQYSKRVKFLKDWPLDSLERIQDIKHECFTYSKSVRDLINSQEKEATLLAEAFKKLPQNVHIAKLSSDIVHVLNDIEKQKSIILKFDEEKIASGLRGLPKEELKVDHIELSHCSLERTEDPEKMGSIKSVDISTLSDLELSALLPIGTKEERESTKKKMENLNDEGTLTMLWSRLSVDHIKLFVLEKREDFDYKQQCDLHAKKLNQLPDEALNRIFSSLSPEQLYLLSPEKFAANESDKLCKLSNFLLEILFSTGRFSDSTKQRLKSLHQVGKLTKMWDRLSKTELDKKELLALAPTSFTLSLVQIDDTAFQITLQKVAKEVAVDGAPSSSSELDRIRNLINSNRNDIKKITAYQILNLSDDVIITKDVVKEHFLKLSSVFLNDDSDEATEIFHCVCKAKRLLDNQLNEMLNFYNSLHPSVSRVSTFLAYLS